MEGSIPCSQVVIRVLLSPLRKCATTSPLTFRSRGTLRRQAGYAPLSLHVGPREVMSPLASSPLLSVVPSRALGFARVRALVSGLAPRLLPRLAGVGCFGFAAYRSVVLVGRGARQIHHPSLFRRVAPSLSPLITPLLLAGAGVVAKVGGSRQSVRRGSPVVPLLRARALKTLRRWSPTGNAGVVRLSERHCFVLNRQWLRSPWPNPAFERTCAKSRAGRSTSR